MNENYVVQIIDALAKQFGLAIDWTSQNVMPYMQDLMTRIVNHEIGIGIFWMIFLPIATIAFGIVGVKCIKKAKEIDRYDWAEEAPGIIGIVCSILGVIGLVATLVVVPYFSIRIIECVNIPEKIFIEYMTNFIN